jgi:hypothetical protein
MSMHSSFSKRLGDVENAGSGENPDKTALPRLGYPTRLRSLLQDIMHAQRFFVVAIEIW